MPKHNGLEIFHHHAIKLNTLIAPWVASIKSLTEVYKKLNQGLNASVPLNDIEALNLYMECIEATSYDTCLDEWITDPICSSS